MSADPIKSGETDSVKKEMQAGPSEKKSKLQKLNMVSTLSSSAEENVEKASLIHYRDVIEEGNVVLIYVDSDTLIPIVVQRGKNLDMKNGQLRHDFIIGRRFGAKISATAGFVYALRPNPMLMTRVVRRFTQILYPHDIGVIIQLLDIKPGSVICESGTGSGALTHALAVAVGKEGHVYSHDVVEQRVKGVERSLAEHGLAGITTVVVHDVTVKGFFVENGADGVFLDLPEPWKAISFAKKAMSRFRGGRIVSFSPCIEQSLKTAEAMSENNFQFIETIEVVPRLMKVAEMKQHRLDAMATDKFPPEYSETDVVKEAASTTTAPKDVMGSNPKFSYKQTIIPFPAKQPSHSGYLTHATILPFK